MRCKIQNLNRSPTKFNNPSGVIWITAKSPQSIICCNPCVYPFLSPYTVFQCTCMIILTKTLNYNSTQLY